MTKHYCCYVLEPAAKNKAAIYCNKPITDYKIIKDDDGNKIRKYSLFCKKHEKM